MLRNARSVLVATTALAGLAACEQITDSPEQTGVVGVYEAQSVDGNTYPVLVSQGAGIRTYHASASISLLLDGQYRMELISREEQNGAVVDTDTVRAGGSYRMAGDSVYLTTAAGELGAAVRGRVMTAIAGGRTYIYRRK